jgi:hypothetical protein
MRLYQANPTVSMYSIHLNSVEYLISLGLNLVCKIDIWFKNPSCRD